MKSTVCIAFDTDEVLVNLSGEEAPMSAEDARRWLDEQFTANDCKPLRASGKVLTADKVLAIAGAIGPERFRHDEALRGAFARAAAAALARPTVRIDVEARTVSF